MTAAHAHPSWSLPHRQHEHHPDDLQARVEWRVERQIAEYCDSDDVDWMEMIADTRPDLSWSEVFEQVERLCVLSDEVYGFELRGDSWTGAAEVARAEYSDALAKLATKPDGAR